MRLAQTQVCPLLRYLEIIAPSTAASRSASSNTRKGALPPSSSDTFLMVAALCAMSCAPTSVEPVKLILRTVVFDGSSPPISLALPVAMLITPLVTPARPASSASAKAEEGVCAAGWIPRGHQDLACG